MMIIKWKILEATNEDGLITHAKYFVSATDESNTVNSSQVVSLTNPLSVASGGTGAANLSSITVGSATTAINLSTNRTNWSTNGTITAVVGQLAWKNYSNNHTIFDASASTAPDGSSINSSNSQNAWTTTYPTLMGWNGSNTYGVRVDSARLADNGFNTSISGNLYGSTRASNVTYTNSTGNPKIIYLGGTNSPTNGHVQIFLNGTQYSAANGYGSIWFVNIVVPVGYTYRFVNNGATITVWAEL